MPTPDNLIQPKNKLETASPKPARPEFAIAGIPWSDKPGSNNLPEVMEYLFGGEDKNDEFYYRIFKHLNRANPKLSFRGEHHASYERLCEVLVSEYFNIKNPDSEFAKALVEYKVGKGILLKKYINDIPVFIFDDKNSGSLFSFCFEQALFLHLHDGPEVFKIHLKHELTHLLYRALGLRSTKLENDTDYKNYFYFQYFVDEFYAYGSSGIYSVFKNGKLKDILDSFFHGKAQAKNTATYSQQLDIIHKISVFMIKYVDSANPQKALNKFKLYLYYHIHTWDDLVNLDIKKVKERLRL